MSDKLEMPVEQFSEAVAKENARLNKRIEKLEKTLNDVIETLDLDYSNEIPYMLRNRYACTIAKLGLENKK